MHSVFVDALKRQSGAVHLRQAVRVVSIDSVKRFDLFPDVFAVRFGADVRLFQGKISGTEAFLPHDVVHMQQI